MKQNCNLPLEMLNLVIKNFVNIEITGNFNS